MDSSLPALDRREVRRQVVLRLDSVDRGRLAAPVGQGQARLGGASQAQGEEARFPIGPYLAEAQQIGGGVEPLAEPVRAPAGGGGQAGRRSGVRGAHEGTRAG
jgi:hypothetical protein